MKLYLDTSTSTCILKLDSKEYRAELGRDMAEKIFTFLEEKLTENHKSWHDITEITYMSGPGSFTGLRIGAAVVNTLADQLQIPLYDHHGNLCSVILPEYGRDANITKPKK